MSRRGAVPNCCHRMLYCRWYCTAISARFNSDAASVLDPMTVIGNRSYILVRGSPAIHNDLLQAHVAGVTGKQWWRRGAAGCCPAAAPGSTLANRLQQQCSTSRCCSTNWSYACYSLHLLRRPLAAGANADRMHVDARCCTAGAAPTSDQHPGAPAANLLPDLLCARKMVAGGDAHMRQVIITLTACWLTCIYSKFPHKFRRPAG
jgi:hypothetical protein